MNGKVVLSVFRGPKGEKKRKGPQKKIAPRRDGWKDETTAASGEKGGKRWRGTERVNIVRLIGNKKIDEET